MNEPAPAEPAAGCELPDKPGRWIRQPEDNEPGYDIIVGKNGWSGWMGGRAFSGDVSTLIRGHWHAASGQGERLLRKQLDTLNALADGAVPHNTRLAALLPNANHAHYIQAEASDEIERLRATIARLTSELEAARALIAKWRGRSKRAERMTSSECRIAGAAWAECADELEAALQEQPHA